VTTPVAPEVAFTAPWEGRVFAMAIGVVESLDLPWSAFQAQLIAAISADPDRPYYESWLAALESLVAEEG
jgi:nitrile hydratase accessory protein